MSTTNSSNKRKASVLEERTKTMPSQPEYRYEVVFVTKDKYSDLLHPITPSDMAFYRYLAFYIRDCKTMKPVKSGNRVAVRLNITEETGECFNVVARNYFKGGVYYFENINLSALGKHEVIVSAESEKWGPNVAKPFQFDMEVFEFVSLQDCPELKQGLYGPLREFVEKLKHEKTDDEVDLFLDDEDALKSALKDYKLKLRKSDVSSWFSMYARRRALAAKKQAQLAKNFAKEGARSHPRKQSTPVRSGTEREQVNFFGGKAREVKRYRSGRLRIFTQERLAANSTVLVFSAQQLFTQLHRYATA